MRPPPIPPNPNRSRANIFICVTLLIIGLSISSIIILSLIPVYLEDKSATTSRTGRSARSVDTFDSSQYIFNKSQTKQKQSIEKWYSSSALTLQLILSMQNQVC
ncbi:hypothetical protein I4U23_015026 [Adineta vaga]|nr:hypothetical protein I4U23_015026 [Adineta vaga]